MEDRPDLSAVTHVAVGLSVVFLTGIDRLLPPRSVLVLDEPETLRARRGRERTAGLECLAGIIEAPTQDEARAERLSGMLPRPERLRAVVPLLEYGVVAAAALAEAWRVPGAGLDAARLLRDKALLRERAAAGGVDQPEWAVVDGPDGVERFRERHGRRCVVKPANRQASVGVRLLDEDDDAAAAWAAAAAADEPRQRAGYALPPKHLVERRLDGPEYSVEALVADGTIEFANVTAKSVRRGPSPVETGHVVPAGLPGPRAEALVEATRELVEATGFRTGVVHAEWILAEGRPHLVECAGRLPGDSIVRLVDLSRHCDLTGEYLRVLAGGRPSLPAEPERAAAIRFLTAPPGRVGAVEGVERARLAPGVVEAEVSVEVGEETGAVTNSWERSGHVIATGETSERAERRARAAAGLIRITTEQ